MTFELISLGLSRGFDGIKIGRPKKRRISKSMRNELKRPAPDVGLVMYTQIMSGRAGLCEIHESSILTCKITIKWY